MYTLFTVLILIAAVLLILIVLVQNSKGGGLAANFQSSNQMLGVRKTTDFLEKATWVLSISIVVLSIAASLSIHSTEVEVDDNKSMLEERAQDWNDDAPTVVPNLGEENSEEEAE